MEVQIEIVNKSPHPLPAYQTEGSAGMDLHAWLPAPVQLQPLERRLIPTGLSLSLPRGWEAQIRPRSGTAIRNGISIVNAPGTIDSDFRGDIQIPVINLSAEVQTIADGDRVAQMVIAAHATARWTETDSLDATERGPGGFGHTGK